MFPRRSSAMNMFFSFDVHITREGEKAIQANLIDALGDILKKRSYFFKVINATEFEDRDADTRGRKCMRAAMYCFENGFHSEALSWYLEGHKFFCGENDCEIRKDNEDCIMRYNEHIVQWDIYTETWLNTAYGSSKRWMQCGYMCSYVGHLLSDEMLEKRQLGWEKMIAEEQAVIKRNEEAMVDFFTYDDVKI